MLAQKLASYFPGVFLLPINPVIHPPHVASCYATGEAL